MFTFTGSRMRSTPVSELLDALRASVAVLSDGTTTAVHDFTEEPAMSCSFMFDFEEVPLVPGTATPMTGVADIQYDASGDWSIVGIEFASDKIDGASIAADRRGDLYQHIASRIEIHCRQDIDAMVGEVMAERRGEARRMMAAE